MTAPEHVPGTEVSPDVDMHTTAGRLADLHRRNEEAVHAFHAGRISFPAIVDTIAAVVAEHSDPSELTVGAVLSAEAWARTRTHERLGML